MTNIIINIKNLTYSYNKSLSFKYSLFINEGEIVALIGKSGCGKTTLLNLIAGFIKPKKGKIIIDNKDVSKIRAGNRPVTMLFQENNLFDQLNIFDNILLGIHPFLKKTKDDKEKILDIAKKLEIEYLLKKYPNELSGGEKQRAAIARCLLSNKPILLMDEPLSALDKNLRTKTLELIIKTCKIDQKTLLLVTHHLEEIIHHFDKSIEIH